MKYVQRPALFGSDWRLSNYEWGELAYSLRGQLKGDYVDYNSTNNWFNSLLKNHYTPKAISNLVYQNNPFISSGFKGYTGVQISIPDLGSQAIKHVKNTGDK